jgi:galactokinase
VLDSGERRELSAGQYNVRREECVRACQLLGIASLREAGGASAAALPAVLAARVRHVVSENARVVAAVEAVRDGDFAALGALLNASHASLRDSFEVSTAALEATVSALRDAGATGARVIGGGFGGSVLGLMPPGVPPPAGAVEVRPSTGAFVL